MKPTIIEDEIFEFEPFEEDGSGLLVAETSWRGMAGHKFFSVERTLTLSIQYHKLFRKRYEK